MEEREKVFCTECKKDVFLKKIVYNPSNLIEQHIKRVERKEIVHIKRRLENDDALYACGECETPLSEYGIFNDSWKIEPSILIKMMEDHKNFFGNDKQN